MFFTNEVTDMKKKTMALVIACTLTITSGCMPQNGEPNKSNVVDTQTTTPATEYQKAVIYLPDENGQSLIGKEVQIEKNNEPMVELVQALVTEKALPAGTEVEKWSVSKDDAPAVTLDLNTAFADGILNTGSTGETIMLGSLINTVWEYFKPASLTLTVDGQPLETGHNIYDEPFNAPMDITIHDSIE